MADRSNVSL